MAPARSSASPRDFVLLLYKVVELFKILRNYAHQRCVGRRLLQLKAKHPEIALHALGKNDACSPIEASPPRRRISEVPVRCGAGFEARRA
jgi:hypothetical protein